MFVTQPAQQAAQRLGVSLQRRATTRGQDHCGRHPIPIPCLLAREGVIKSGLVPIGLGSAASAFRLLQLGDLRSCCID